MPVIQAASEAPGGSSKSRKFRSTSSRCGNESEISCNSGTASTSLSSSSSKRDIVVRVSE